MKTAILVALTMTILGFSEQSLAKFWQCSENVNLNIQGQELHLEVLPSARGIKAKLAGKEVFAKLEPTMNSTIIVEIPETLRPNLTPAQKGDYREDHHTIHQYYIKVELNEVKQVTYERFQDIDYGNRSASTKMKFTSNVKTTCVD